MNDVNNMTREEVILNRHRYMFGEYFDSVPEGTPIPPMKFGIECGPGWWPLIAKLIDDIAKLDTEKQVVVTQIKEKFGGLRFYIVGGTDEIYRLIYKAETQSYKICENCGRPGQTCQGGGWLQTLCPDCASKDNYTPCENEDT